MNAIYKLSRAEVARQAENFLGQYHPSMELPIPIEDIVDVKMRLNIVPFPRLYKDHGLNGFLTADRSEIWVDEIQSEQFRDKYRFTLAHEIGHYFLHDAFYKSANFNTIEEYRKWILTIPKQEIDWFEAHSDWFAGLVLVPTKPLISVCLELARKHKPQVGDLIYRKSFWSYAAQEIALDFEVNPPVVEIRIREEKVIERVKETI